MIGSSGTSPERRRSHSPFLPIIASMLGLVGWLVFILLYALFWSKGYSLFQNIIVTFFSLAIVVILIGMFWMVWGYRRWGGFRGWSGWNGTS
jgi:hypothetical protein